MVCHCPRLELFFGLPCDLAVAKVPSRSCCCCCSCRHASFRLQGAAAPMFPDEDSWMVSGNAAAHALRL